MSDFFPPSWNDPNAPQRPEPEPVTDRDGRAVATRDGALMARPFGDIPSLPAVHTFHYEPHFHGQAADPHVAETLERLLSATTAQENRTMAAFADLKAQLDALKANVDRGAARDAERKAQLEEANRKLDELKNISDNGTEEEFSAAVEQLKAINDKMAADAEPTPVTPTPAEPAPVEPAPAPVEPVPAEPVAEQPAPAEPAPAEQPADAAAPDGRFPAPPAA